MIDEIGTSIGMQDAHGAELRIGDRVRTAPHEHDWHPNNRASYGTVVGMCTVIKSQPSVTITKDDLSPWLSPPSGIVHAE